jgi:hypothetical protein
MARPRPLLAIPRMALRFRRSSSSNEPEGMKFKDFFCIFIL